MLQILGNVIDGGGLVCVRSESTIMAVKFVITSPKC